MSFWKKKEEEWVCSPGKIPWRHEGEHIGYVLWDSFEELLQKISPAYIRAAYNKVCAHLQANRHYRRNPEHLKFGWLYGMPCVPPGRDSPFAYLGWIWTGTRGWTPEWKKERRALPLLAESPRLQWGTSYRTGIYRCHPGSAEDVLRAVSDFVLDVGQWSPIVLRCGGAGDSPLIAEIVRVLEERDHAGIARILDDASRTCSPEGLRLLTAGIADGLTAPVDSPDE